MKRSDILKVVGFALACAVWAIASLILLGARPGTPIAQSVPAAPKRPLDSLECPDWLAVSQSGLVTGRFTNHSGGELGYHVTIEFTGLENPPQCEQTLQVAEGDFGVASCSASREAGPASAGPITARMTALADDDPQCARDCPNSYSSACQIMPDPSTSVGDSGWKVGVGVALAVELIVLVVGLAVWPGAGWAARAILAALFVSSALLVGYRQVATYHNWLAPALMGGLMAAVLVVWSAWQLVRPRRRDARVKGSL